MSEMIRASIVRIRRESDQQVVGVGFLVDAGKKTILTCAHVVNAAIGATANQTKPRALISLDFPFIDTERRFDARVTHFFPKKADNTDDIAVLEILDDVPADARAVQLARAETYSGHEFGVYGFPQGFEEDSQYVEGKLQERLVNKRIQAVGMSNLGHFVEEGFSGSPVYDKELKAVVGMMMSIADEREKRVAYICPPDVIAGLYADLPFKKIEPVTEVAKVNMPPTASDKWLQRVDIFISSPSDVAEEREAILRVIERLNRQPHIRNRYLLNPLLYEREVPPEAGDYAQIIVDRYMAVEDSYLLICLMWNRMGTSFTHPQTGEEFQSGTEYEFTIGYRANTQKGRPHLLLYRKTTEQTDIDEAEKEKVDTFFRRFEGKGATFKGLYKLFSALREFEEMLFDHIGLILHDKPPISTRSVAEDSLFTSVNPSRSLSYEQSRLAGTTSKRVFICYSELDGTDLAEFVYEAFYQSGCPAWIDYKHIAEGVDEDEIDEAIDEALANCDSVVILVTPAARKKPASTYWREALRREKHIIPVFFVKPDDAPLQIRHKRGFYVPAFSELTNQLPNIISAVGCSKTESASTLSNLKTIQLEPQEKIFTSASNPPSVVDERSAYEYVLELLGKRAYQEIIDWTNDLSKDVLSAELYSIRAIAYKGLGQSSLIRQELEVAKQLAPHDPERYLESAENHLDVGRVREAFEDFEKALQLDPDLQETVYLETSAVVIFVRHADQLPMPLFDEIEGRSELTFTLRQALGSGQAVLLYGMGGIGKTALTTLIAQEYLKDGRNVLWVNVGSARLETLLSTIGQEIERALDEGKSFNQAESTDQKAGYIAKWLQREKPLLVLDDAWNPEETKQFLMTVIPAQCPIIVTTRRTDFDDIEGVIKIDIPHLTPEAAVTLYQAINDAENDIQAITALCKTLNYHPLAIRLAALKAKRETQTSAQLLNQIGTGSSKNSIRAIFDAVVGDIGDRATNVFLVIGALPVTRVTDEFIAITLDETATEIAGLLRDLASLGLINPTVTPDNEPFYAVHDLTYAYAHDLLVEQSRTDELEHAVVKAACRYVERFSNNTPDNFRKLAVERPTLIASITRAKGYQDHASIYALVDGLLTFLDYQGYSIDYLNVLSIASEAAETQQDRRKQARYCNELATISVRLGRYQQAIQYLEMALVVSREFGDRRSEGSMIGNLANVYVSLGELDRAIEYYEIALNIAREIGDRAGEATTLNNLGTVWDSRGDKRKALELYEQSLPLIREIGDLREEATTLSNIGAVWDALGEKRRALDYYEQALPISRAIDDRRGEATHLTNIGAVYDDLGDKQKALQYYEYVLPLFRAIADLRGEGITLNNIGEANAALGLTDQARAYYEQALVIFDRLNDTRNKAMVLKSIQNIQSEIRVYLSYARSDDNPDYNDPQKSFMRLLYNTLTEAGFNVWWDRESMPSRGLAFTQEIEQAIRQCDRFLLVVGPGSVASAYVRAEWQLALEQCKPIIPVLRAGDYQLIPNELLNLNAIDARPSRDEVMVVADIVQLLQNDAPIGRIVGVPSLPRAYITRDALFQQARDALLRDAISPLIIQTAQRAIVVSGMGGVGKSTLAAALAHDCQVRRSFPDGIIWIEVGQHPFITSLQATIGIYFGDSRDNYLDEQSGTFHLSRVLQDKKALIVLDDVWDHKVVEKFPVNGTACRLLVTTRSRTVAKVIGGIDLGLYALTPAEGAQLISNRTGVDPNDPSIAAIVNLLAGNTLAITLAAGMIAERYPDAPAKVLERLQRRAAESHPFRDLTLDDIDKNLNLELSLSLSYEALSADMQRRFRSLGVFDVEDTFDAEMLVNLWGDAHELDTEDALYKLVNASLINPTEVRGRYMQHPLLRGYARSLLIAVGEYDATSNRYANLIRGGNINISGQQSFAGNITIGDTGDKSDSEGDE